MIPRTDDLLRVLPEAIWCGFGVILMLLQPFTRSRQVFTFFAILGTGLGTAATIFAGHPGGSAFFGLIQMDAFSVFFHFSLRIPIWTASACSLPSSTPWCSSPRPAWACSRPHRNCSPPSSASK